MEKRPGLAHFLKKKVTEENVTKRRIWWIANFCECRNNFAKWLKMEKNSLSHV